MRVTPKAFIIFILLILVVGNVSAAPGDIPNAAPALPWQSKVDPWVLETGTAGETEFLVYLTEQADLGSAAALKTKLEKGTFVYEKLTEVATRTQPGVITALKSQNAQYKSYWVANMIWVRGNLTVVQAMSERSDVAHIYANPEVKTDVPTPNPTAEAPASPNAIEWNIIKVNADDVWAAGFTGQGAVIGGQDTGYDWDHPALKNQYRGWNGGSADHNYNWHDAIHSGGGVCGPDSPEPCDDHFSSHGTHTMGTMVGDDGGGNQIGMAPGARWIGCRNMNVGVGTPTTYAECYQWFIAPTDLNDQNPDPSKAPDVINNSWGCPPSEGCTDPNVLLTVVNNVRAAGILTAHSAGNYGYQGCSTVNEPPAIYDASFTVGATDSSDNIASFSSRGPVTIDGSNRMKPDISAPGVNVRSSIRNGVYGTSSGTSMAAPHVAGLVGLLISANPGLAGQVDVLENVIQQQAIPRTTAQGCGSDSSTDIPNNVYGWGRIDSLQTFKEAYYGLILDKSASADAVSPDELLTYTLDLTFIQPNGHSTSNVVITDTLPVGTAFVTATLPHSFDGSTVRWDFASMSANETQSVELVVQVSRDARGTVDNNDYGVRSDDTATIMGDPVSVNIAAFDQMLTKTAPGSVAPGGTLTYTLAVTNPYESKPIHNLVLTDTLPVNTTFITATLPATVNGDLITWTLDELEAGETWNVQLVVQAPIVFAGKIVNEKYGVRSDEVDTLLGSPLTTAVHSLALTKSAMPELADIGNLITYTLTITNQHPMSAIHNIVLADLLPEDTAYVSSDGSLDEPTGVVTWTIPSLSLGETRTVHLTVEVLPGAFSSINNLEYSITSDETPEPHFGEPVSTRLQLYFYLPLMHKNYVE